MAQKLSTSETRILITKAVGREWNKINDSALRAFEATGTWLPIDHCVGEGGSENGSRDAEVDLQHFENLYDYQKTITRTAILERIQKIQLEKNELTRLESEEREQRVREVEQMNDVYANWIQQGEEAWEIHSVIIKTTASASLLHVAKQLNMVAGNKFYVVGSWAAKLVSEHCSTHSGMEPVDLIANDIDIFLPKIDRRRDNKFEIDLRSVKKIKVNEVPAWEINTIDCYNSSITALHYFI